MWDGGASYLAVNEVLNDILFDGRFAGRPLYLDIEGALLEVLGRALKVEEEEVRTVFSQAVKNSLNFDFSNPFVWHERKYNEWWYLKQHNLPPFTCLLCTLSIAAENMHRDDKFSSSNYYERLFEVLGIANESEKEFLKKHFHGTRKYWEALNRWLSEKEGSLGRPTAAQVISHWKYVSYPISQALIRETDRDLSVVRTFVTALGLIFRRIGLVLLVSFRRRSCGVASADVRWSAA